MIAVVGLGYVGLVTAVCLARLGQDVVGLDSDERKVDQLAKGIPTFFEPGLEGELRQNAERLRFTSDVTALESPECVMICVGTPSAADGTADLTAVTAVADTIGDRLQHRAVIALRSTVPVGTSAMIEQRINDRLRERSASFEVSVVANPEFLRTGRAIDDFLRPSRLILGHTDGTSAADLDYLSNLYRPLEAPVFVLDARSAELVKNASNSYLALRISFANELARLCEQTGASIVSVLSGVGADPRIGPGYLRPGLGYGGSCLPKDVRSLIAMGQEHGEPMALMQAVKGVNDQQVERVVDRLEAALGRPLSGSRVAVLGLAFKPDTDDVRESPALAMVAALRRRGAEVVAADPEASATALAVDPDLVTADTPAEAAAGADAVVLATGWPAYVSGDFPALATAMRGSLFLDACLAADPEAVTSAGLSYVGVGTPAL
jgi:UDPglucose 6-dehydrogenase